MRKSIIVLMFVLMLVVSAFAEIKNVVGTSSINTISCQGDGAYNHCWAYVNGEYRGDFYTLASGTATFVTQLNEGDHIMILWYNVSEGYGQFHAYSD